MEANALPMSIFWEETNSSLRKVNYCDCKIQCFLKFPTAIAVSELEGLNFSEPSCPQAQLSVKLG